jgi:hypothetical protein
MPAKRGDRTELRPPGNLIVQLGVPTEHGLSYRTIPSHISGLGGSESGFPQDRGPGSDSGWWIPVARRWGDRP